MVFFYYSLILEFCTLQTTHVFLALLACGGDRLDGCVHGVDEQVTELVELRRGCLPFRHRLGRFALRLVEVRKHRAKGCGRISEIRGNWGGAQREGPERPKGLRG